MRRLLKELGKDGVITFDDITAATALYRPGPMESGMMDSYWKRKQGLEHVEYDHPLMEPILKPTFGVMVYQEQVMQVARVIAGYSAPDADKLRKIMGKKLPEEMAKERGKFVAGCVATVGMRRGLGGRAVRQDRGFAGYGFNKSHSVEYTLISYQAMWLKTYYPVEFVAAALTLMKEDKLPACSRTPAPRHRDRPARHQYLDRPVRDPHRHQAGDPVQPVKGISVNAAKAIVEARGGHRSSIRPTSSELIPGLVTELIPRRRPGLYPRPRGQA
jgi:DNA polymerase-3 subunit alpha